MPRYFWIFDYSCLCGCYIAATVEKAEHYLKEHSVRTQESSKYFLGAEIDRVINKVVLFQIYYIVTFF